MHLRVLSPGRVLVHGLAFQLAWPQLSSRGRVQVWPSALLEERLKTRTVVAVEGCGKQLAQLLCAYCSVLWHDGSL